MTVIWEIAPSSKGSASPVIRGSSLLTVPADPPGSDWTCQWNAMQAKDCHLSADRRQISCHYLKLTNTKRQMGSKEAN